MSKEIAVVLSGCGVFDGAEINETVLTHIAIIEAEYSIQFYAPSGNQTSVVNHATQSEQEEGARSIFDESARIARGEIKPLSDIDLDSTSAVIFPGGFGAAKNLSNFAEKGADAWVNSEVEKVIIDAHTKGTPIGCMCIAPAVIALVLGKNNVVVTIGTDEGTASAIEQTGAKHESKNVDQICCDEANKVVSTPAYMLAQDIIEAKSGISKLVTKIIDLIEQSVDIRLAN